MITVLCKIKKIEIFQEDSWLVTVSNIAQITDPNNMVVDNEFSIILTDRIEKAKITVGDNYNLKFTKVE